MKYQAEFEDNEIEVFDAESNEEAITEAFKMEKDHGNLFNVTLLDDDYEEVETIF